VSVNSTASYDDDVLGNLRSATLPGSSTVTYAIDPMNRRIARNFNGAGLSQQLVFSGLHPVAQLTNCCCAGWLMMM
jgi:hypothetical protein